MGVLLFEDWERLVFKFMFLAFSGEWNILLMSLLGLIWVPKGPTKSIIFYLGLYYIWFDPYWSPLTTPLFSVVYPKRGFKYVSPEFCKIVLPWTEPLLCSKPYLECFLLANTLSTVLFCYYLDLAIFLVSFRLN